MYDNPQLILDPAELPEESAEITWRSPSNLAIIKYWGKHGEQLPRNPSVSLTLAASVTDMAIEYTPREEAAESIAIDYLFHDEPNEAFQGKLENFLTRLLPVFPFLNQFDLAIRSGNSFPHSAGIASSASAMSALALCLCSMEDALFGTLSDPTEFERKASYVARLGSGSACRSIYGYAAVWGETPLVPGSSDEYAVAGEALLHPIFKTLQNDILIVSSAEKAVSSRAGHALMEGNAFADPRYAQARERLEHLLGALRAGDVEAFGKIAEDEAMTLHALMMASDPSYVLLQPNTLTLIEKVRAYRHDTGLPIFFSLDAGPNLHVLYPDEHVHEIRVFVDEELRPLCENGMIQHDWVGEGPEEM